MNKIQFQKFNVVKIKTLSLVILSITFISCGKTNVSQPDTANQSDKLLLATAWYQQSAEMRACYYQSYRMAQMALESNLQNYKGEKPTAVILDIDETVLDNSPFEAKLIADRESYSDSTWKAWSNRGAALALPGAPEFISFAKQKGVEVFFISNRKHDEREKTLENLAKAGMPTDSANLLTRAQGKSSCKDERREQVASEYEILLFVGDNLGDYKSLFDNRDNGLAISLTDSLQNDFGTKFIILPNPMYGEWENAIYEYDYSATTDEKNKKILDLLVK